MCLKDNRERFQAIRQELYEILSLNGTKPHRSAIDIIHAQRRYITLRTRSRQRAARSASELENTARIAPETLPPTELRDTRMYRFRTLEISERMPASPVLTRSRQPWGGSPGTAALPFANVECVRLRREQTIRMAGHPPGWSIDRLQFPTDSWSVLGGLGELASQRRGATGNLVPLAVIARNRGLTAQHADNNHLTARVLIKITIALNHFKTLFNQFSDVNVRNRTVPGQATGGQLHRPLCRFCATPVRHGSWRKAGCGICRPRRRWPSVTEHGRCRDSACDHAQRRE